MHVLGIFTSVKALLQAIMVNKNKYRSKNSDWH